DRYRGGLHAAQRASDGERSLRPRVRRRARGRDSRALSAHAAALVLRSRGRRGGGGAALGSSRALRDERERREHRPRAALPFVRHERLDRKHWAQPEHAELEVQARRNRLRRARQPLGAALRPVTGHRWLAVALLVCTGVAAALWWKGSTTGAASRFVARHSSSPRSRGSSGSAESVWVSAARSAGRAAPGAIWGRVRDA